MSSLNIQQDIIHHPIVAAWVQQQLRSHGICGGKSDIGIGFLRVLQFPLTIFIPPTAAYSLILPSLTLYSLDTDSVVK
jgi:hypothetical protein